MTTPQQHCRIGPTKSLRVALRQRPAFGGGENGLGFHERSVPTLAMKRKRPVMLHFVAVMMAVIVDRTVSWESVSSMPRPNCQVSAFTSIRTISPQGNGWRCIFCLQQGRVKSSRSASVSGIETDRDGRSRFTGKLAEALDLLPLLCRVGEHAATRRGREALLSLVSTHSPPSLDRRPTASSLSGAADKSSSLSSRQRRAFGTTSSSTASPLASNPSLRVYRYSLAPSLEQVRIEYDRVEQATLALYQPRGDREDILNGALVGDLSYPPLYATSPGRSSQDNSAVNPESQVDDCPWSPRFVVDTDDDEWLYFRDLEDFQVEHVLQAEQVIKMLLAVHDWAMKESVQTWAPLLAEIAACIRSEELSSALGSVLHAVEVVRARSAVDPRAQSTYRFELNATTFPVMSRLRDELRDLEEARSSKSRAGSKTRDGRLVEAKLEEIQTTEREILHRLVLSIAQARGAIHHGMNVVAELDVVFAKAAFGLAVRGRIPRVARGKNFHALEFVHPLLDQQAVPIDLRSVDGKQALVISGINGGGKTLALKSFGVAACLVRMGIPIPTRASLLKEECRPRVDFFDDILTSIGDGQDLERGESTYTSRLNTYAAIIEIVSAAPRRTSLVLLDELGSGTEPTSGGAIGQAILESLLQFETCRTVLTTHSSRLKTLSFDSEGLECASVLCSRSQFDANLTGLPTYHLQYGVIGESDALFAAARTSPALPAVVLERANQLAFEAEANTGFGSDGESREYIRALSASLENQVLLAGECRVELQMEAKRAIKCRTAMIALANAYDRHLSFLQNRVEDCYQRLRADSGDSLTIAGETLSELKLVRKIIKSETDLIQEQGLKVLPESHVLVDGESVVIVADEEWHGMTGRVRLNGESVTEVARDDVEVILPCNSMDDWIQIGRPGVSEATVVFKRHQLAIWDYESVWQDINHDVQEIRATSIQDTKRRFSDILTRLKSESTGENNGKHASRITPTAFKSSRERKSANKKVKRQRR